MSHQLLFGLAVGDPNIRVSILQRFFFTFPDGLPGIALFLLRTAIGVAVLVQGEFYLRAVDTSQKHLAVGVVAILCGFLLVVGFLTPLVAGVVGLSALGIWFSLLPPCTPTLFDSEIVLGFGATILFASIILGPGAFSVDARLFGRREIFIPPRSKLNE
jgi:uncharacterized membrane protein YphA (DoxX/SURF4 family)